MSFFADLIQVPFGYILQYLYEFTQNYGVSLILFGIFIKLVLLPVSMKSKKSMMKMSRMAPLAKKLEVKYAGDRAKYQTEVMKLYKREGVSTTGGCLWSFIPLLILIPLYQVIREPMVYMMGIAPEIAAEITTTINSLLIESGIEAGLGGNNYYHQMGAVSHITELMPQLQEAIPALKGLEIVPISFDFLGLNMGVVPSWQFWSFTTASALGLFLIPMVSGLSNFGTMFISQKLNATVATDVTGSQDKSAASATAGTMKTMMYMMPVMSIWIGFQMPAGMSIYWITQAVIGVAQEYFLTKHYRKIYDAEDVIRKARYAEEEAIEAEKERVRAERRAKHPEGIQDPNTSKKKISNKDKSDNDFGIDGKLSPAEKELLLKYRAEMAETKHFSGDTNRPNSRGRAYKSVRNGRDTSQSTDVELTPQPDEQETATEE